MDDGRNRNAGDPADPIITGAGGDHWMWTLQQASFRRYEDFYAGQCICHSSSFDRYVSGQGIFFCDPCYFRGSCCGHCHVKRQLHSFQFQEPDQGTDYICSTLGLRFYGLNGWDRNVYFRICDLYGTSLWDFPVPICRALFKRPFQSFWGASGIKEQFQTSGFCSDDS